MVKNTMSMLEAQALVLEHDRRLRVERVFSEGRKTFIRASVDPRRSRQMKTAGPNSREAQRRRRQMAKVAGRRSA